MRIIIGGDFVVSKDNLDSFSNGKIENVFSNDLLNLWYSTDFRVLNLEAPICGTECNKIQKCGPNLKIEKSAIKGIKKLNPSLVCLSNNHIMDFGEDGLKQTIDILQKNNIPYVGVGLNVSEARHNCTYKNEGVVIINCCEHEFSVASETNAGAYPYSNTEIRDLIIQAKANNNYVIVIYHGGKEEYRFPTPELKKRCDYMASLGANFIVCQHTHCIGCYENNHDCTTLFGQGNFLFKGYKTNEYWETGLLVEINTENNKIIYHPIVSDDKIRLARLEEKETILYNFLLRSDSIRKNGFINDSFDDYVQTRLISYLCKLFCFSKIRTWLEKKVFRGFFVKRKIKKHSGLVLYNLLVCEPHYEILIRAIETTISNKKA